jgi:hypothetical protein
MWQKEIGECPSGELPDDLEWRWWQVNWSIKFLRSFCADPYPWGILACSSEDPEEIGPPDNPKPLGVSFYYVDEAEEEADSFWEKYSEAYRIFCDGVNWREIHPKVMQDCFRRLGYNDYFRPKAKQSKPMIASSDEQLDEIERMKDDKCDLELVRLPAIFDENGEWIYFLSHWMQSYIDLVCGGSPPGCQINILWNESKRSKIVRTGLPAKVISGWGLSWQEKRTDAILQFSEKFRIACYRFLLSVDWKALNGDFLISKYLPEE